MTYTYLNQRNYPNVPYPHASRPSATVATSGCGVCCAAMALANVTDFSVTVAEMAQYAIRHGARDAYGTNLQTLLAAMKQDYAGFDYRLTDSKGELVTHLKSGGAAIANVGGDRGNYKGIFCTTGHFVYVAGLIGNDQLIILDPDEYDGKYDGWRSAHVTQLGEHQLQCDPLRLDEDCSNRSPRYYLVAGVKSGAAEPEAPAKPSYSYSVGQQVVFSTCYTSSDAPIESNIPASKMARNHGTITRIANGARNPYLLDNGLCWVNDGDIRGLYNGNRNGTVATNKLNLNVRAKPSTSGKILGTFPKGASVEIISESNGWYQVRRGTLTGWCAAKYIK